MRPGLLLILLAWAWTSVRAQDSAIPADELARAPSATRIATLVDQAASRGWGSVAPTLRTAALQAYATDSGYVPAWYYLYRWADLLATP